MRKTDAVTSCTPATTEPRNNAPLRAAVAGLAFAAGRDVSYQALAQTARPAPGATDQGRVLLDTLNQVDALGRQVRELRGQVEDTGNRVDQVRDGLQKADQRQGELYGDTDARLRRLEQAAKDELTERRKLQGQLTDLELRLKKFEADLDVQMRKFEADLEARIRRLEGAAPASGVGTGSGESEARPRRGTEAPGDGGVARSAVESVPGAASSPVAAPGTAALAAQTGAAAAVATPGASTTAPAVGVEPLSPSKAYEFALGRQRAGDPAGAIQGFLGFLRQYPKHELAPNAQYWLGEAYLKAGEFGNAIAAQQKLMQSYPDHLKIPDSMLILSGAQAGNGDVAAARKTLEELISRYPLSESADKAKQRLSRLK